MVRFNMMNIPEEPSSPRKEETSRPDQESPPEGEEFFSLDDVENLIQRKETEEVQEMPETEEEPRLELGGSSEESPSLDTPAEHLEDDTSFESTFPKKRLLIILGIFSAIVLGAFLVYWLIRPGETDVMPPVAEQKAASEEATAPEERPSQEDLLLQTQLAANKAENLFLLDILQNILNVRVDGAAPTLAVATPGRILLSLSADSRNAIAGFRIRFKEVMPGMQLELESIEPKMVDGENKLLVDFSVPLVTRVAASQGNAGRWITSRELSSLFQQTARQSGVRVGYFRKGAQERQGMLRTVYHYARVTGTPDQILSFLKRLAQPYPSIKFLKVAIGSENLQEIGNGRVTARITCSLLIPSS